MTLLHIFASCFLLTPVAPESHPGDRSALSAASPAAESREAPGMPWQRNLEDALALVERTGKPLLICVNMDGETASETHARRRYKDPRFIELANGFVPLIVSPNRRTPKDHDSRGRRIPDPKFGRVTNTEAIDLDEALFERYFAGRRVAPRHIGISPTGERLFDIFLVNDYSIIDRALERHGVHPPLVDGASPTEEELLDSPDSRHRDALEVRFFAGDEATRTRIAREAFSSERETQHPEILRMALLDRSEAVRRSAAVSMACNPLAAPIDQFPAALRMTYGFERDRAALVTALETKARESAGRERLRAERLRRVFFGLDRETAVIDVARWKKELEGHPAHEGLGDSSETDFDRLVEVLESLYEQQRSGASGLELQLRITDANMQLARSSIQSGADPRYFLEDALSSVEQAGALSADDPRVPAYRSWAEYLLSDFEASAEDASVALRGLVEDAASELSAEVLNVFAESRTRSLYRAMAEETEWQDEWISEIRVAYEVLLAHPGRVPSHAVSYLGFLEGVEAYAEQSAVLEHALYLSPDSGELHTILRRTALRDGGPSGLEATYERLLRSPEPGHAASTTWFAALGSFVAAEQRVEGDQPAAALRAYRISLNRFDRSVRMDGEFADTANHYKTLALAGVARIHADAERWAEAVGTLSEALALRPASYALEDGLGSSPEKTGRDLLRDLRRRGLDELASQLDELMGLFDEPESE